MKPALRKRELKGCRQEPLDQGYLCPVHWWYIQKHSKTKSHGFTLTIRWVGGSCSELLLYHVVSIFPKKLGSEGAMHWVSQPHDRCFTTQVWRICMDMQACSNFCLRPIPGLNSWRAKSCHSWSNFLNCLILFGEIVGKLWRTGILNEWDTPNSSTSGGVHVQQAMLKVAIFYNVASGSFFFHFLYPSRVVLKVHV